MLYYTVYIKQNTKYRFCFFRECIRLADADIVRLRQYDVDATTSGTSPCQVSCLFKCVRSPVLQQKVTGIQHAPSYFSTAKP